MTAQANPYVRVYYSIVDDPKFHGMKLDTKGAWLDLLIAADSMYPAPAPLPRWLARRHQDELVERGLIDLVGGDHYRIHGLESERSKRSAAGKAGADARWNGSAMRPHSDASMRNDALHSAPNHSTPLRSGTSQSDEERREQLDSLQASMKANGIPTSKGQRAPSPVSAETEPEYVARLQRLVSDPEEVAWKRDAAKAQLEAMRVSS